MDNWGEPVCGNNLCSSKSDLVSSELKAGVCVFVLCTLMCIYYVNSLYIHVCCVHLCFSMERPSTLGARYGHSLVCLQWEVSLHLESISLLSCGLHSEIHGSPYLCLP